MQLPLVPYHTLSCFSFRNLRSIVATVIVARRHHIETTPNFQTEKKFTYFVRFTFSAHSIRPKHVSFLLDLEWMTGPGWVETGPNGIVPWQHRLAHSTVQKFVAKNLRGECEKKTKNGHGRTEKRIHKLNWHSVCLCASVATPIALAVMASASASASAAPPRENQTNKIFRTQKKTEIKIGDKNARELEQWKGKLIS